MPVKKYQGKVIDRQVIAKNTYYLKVQHPQNEQFSFLGGQFVNIEVQSNIRRSYSIASSPVYQDFIDLIADSNGVGPGSLFFERAKVGDQVSYLGPLGLFVYKETDRPSYFFATGTGIVPFMSIMEYQLETLHATKPFKIFSSFRYREEVFGQEPFERLAGQYPNFKYILTVTKPDELWHGNKGRVSEFYQAEIPDPNIDAYICGSHSSILGIKEDLLKLGVPAQQIYYEKFY